VVGKSLDRVAGRGVDGRYRHASFLVRIRAPWKRAEVAPGKRAPRSHPQVHPTPPRRPLRSGSVSDEAGDIAAALARIEICLDDIEGVLGRLGDGSYGSCSSCGHEIGGERLLAEPATRLCGQCALRFVSGQTRPAREDGD
jgi:hypothetical protein